MLKLLHTADWHLGQIFYDNDRRKEHAYFLEQLKQIVARRNIDVLLVAGDVFDSPNPSADAQEMYYRFLHEITAQNPALQIIIIAGNHDSALRLEAPNPLLKILNISIIGVVKKHGQSVDYKSLIVPIKQRGKTVAWCLAVPYLRMGDYPAAENYSQGVEKLFAELIENIPDKSLPVVAMAHLQASGATISKNDKSERLIIGGEEGISEKALPTNLAYFALGHLHRAQHLPHRENACYSGAPLPMSFAERTNKQGVMYVEISEEETKIEKIEIPPLIALQNITAQSVSELLDKLIKLPEGDKNDAPYLEIKVKIDQPEPTLRHRIEEILETKAVNLARLQSYSPNYNENRTDYSDLASDWHAPNPFEMALEIHKRFYGGAEMSDSIKKLLKTTIEELEIQENL
ncbi:MAG: exonuclease SbcCD subunit D [Paludibacter sp.]|jgi:exonuclease SbcD|nr:exonuclease SbcCD subunit D [Paludibacter sp.]